ncbi:hypothetical protein T484DRAFT_1758216 [Baffinella frigidus]|nr:hypothetical protein T484DRAFT_1758216 [Cryptophyta sp. CCMP2293]
MPNDGMRNMNLDRVTLCLNGHNKFEQIFILTGKGSNGKTCTITLEDRVFGDLSYCFNSQTFTEKSRNKNETSEMARTKGMRYAYVQEPDADSKLQVAQLKTITSDKITARDLYKSSVTFKPQFKLNLACNDLPKLSGVDGGISRRLNIIEFVMKYCDNPTNENDRMVNTNLTKWFESDDTYRDALIHILLDNWKNRVSKFNKFVLPPECIAFNSQYISSCNELNEFIETNYEIVKYKDMNTKEPNKIKYSVLYDHFKRINRNDGIDKVKFTSRLHLIEGVDIKKNHVTHENTRSKCDYVFGLKLMEDEDVDENPKAMAFIDDDSDDDPPPP